MSKMEQKNDLSSVRVGDKLYHVRHEECEVIGIDISSHYPIRVRCSDVKSAWFTFDGKEDERDALPTLFLSKPTIIFPPPPEEVEVKGWMNLYVLSNKERAFAGTELYATKEEAIRFRDCRCVGKPIYVCHTYRK